jgi:hypothetical protein
MGVAGSVFRAHVATRPIALCARWDKRMRAEALAAATHPPTVGRAG